MKISDNDLGGVKRSNCQLPNRQLFQIIILLPFPAVPGFSHYAESTISKMFGGKKDILYSFMAQDNVDWRYIEVFFADAKRVLNLAECSARDFSSQIAHVSMVVSNGLNPKSET